MQSGTPIAQRLGMPTIYQKALVALTLTCSAVACGDSGDIEQAAGNEVENLGLTYNDISLLMPVPKKGEEHLLVGLADSSAQSELLSRELFDKVMGQGREAPKVNGDAFDSIIQKYEDWRVISVRFDPCFVQELPNKPCAPLLRVVAQPLSDAFENERLGNGALHLLYSVKDPAAIARRLADIKSLSPVPTSGRLRVHPGLQKEISRGESGELLKAVRGFIQSECNTQDLVSINLFARTRNPPVQGSYDGMKSLFSSFVKDESTGTFTAVKIPTLDPPSEHQTVKDFDNDLWYDYSTLINPLSNAPDNLNDMDLARRKAIAGKSELKELIRRGVRISNPNLHTLFSVDCMSCHLSTNVVQGAGDKYYTSPPEFGDEQNDAYEPLRPEDARIPELYEAASDSNAKLHELFAFVNFGYHPWGGNRAEPSISQRTINETDRCLPLVEKLLAK